MFYVYLLKSQQGEHYYIGYSANLRRRMSEHHQGKVYYTRRYQPWELVYYEAYLDEVQAKSRERRLKQYGSAYVHLLKRLDFKT
jgi:putative endonuclease